MRVGLTGGVGSGKSTVAARLREHGALVIDADQIAREVVEPGTPGYEAVVARFGRGVVAADGTLDRAALADIVFGDAAERDALNSIVHPLVGERTAQLAADAPAGAIVVHDIPLLVEGGLEKAFDTVVVVLAEAELRVARLGSRGMAADDARARIQAQATDEQRRAAADVVIDNNGTVEQLNLQVDALWERLLRGVERASS